MHKIYGKGNNIDVLYTVDKGLHGRNVLQSVIVD